MEIQNYNTFRKIKLILKYANETKRIAGYYVTIKREFNMMSFNFSSI